MIIILEYFKNFIKILNIKTILLKNILMKIERFYLKDFIEEKII